MSAIFSKNRTRRVQILSEIAFVWCKQSTDASVDMINRNFEAIERFDECHSLHL